MSPGRSALALDRVGSSLTGVLEDRRRVDVDESGTSPPVARATACCIASREWSFRVATVNSLKSGLSALFSS